MNLKILYICVATVFFDTCYISVIAEEKGQIEGANMVKSKTISAESNKVECYQSTKYFVVAKDLKDKAGTDFLVKYRSNADEKLPCSYVVANNDFEIPNEWAEYFAGLTGDFLILDSTTGPGPSGLIIWDLNKRKKVYEGLWAGPSKIKDDSIIYWTETGEATEDNCPERANWESHGLGAAIEKKVVLDLFSFSISKTNETRCSPRQ